MIYSILDTDLYKFSTSYAYMKLYPDAEGTFSFTDRNKIEHTEDFITNLKLKLAELSGLSFSFSEKQWCIKHIPYIPEVYWEWLRWFKFDLEKIIVWLDDERHIEFKQERMKIIKDAFENNDIVFFGINCEGCIYLINSLGNIMQNLKDFCGK